MGVGCRCANLLMASRPMGTSIGSQCADPVDLLTPDTTYGVQGVGGPNCADPANMPTLGTP